MLNELGLNYDIKSIIWKSLFAPFFQLFLILCSTSNRILFRREEDVSIKSYCKCDENLASNTIKELDFQRKSNIFPLKAFFLSLTISLSMNGFSQYIEYGIDSVKKTEWFIWEKYITNFTLLQKELNIKMEKK